MFIITCNQEQEPFNELGTNLKQLVLFSVFSTSKNLNSVTYCSSLRKDVKPGVHEYPTLDQRKLG